MKLETLEDLFVDQLEDLYDAENQLVKALPKMAAAAHAPELKAAFQQHLQETEGQVERLEQIFQTLGQKAKGKTCEAMKGLVKEGSETISERATPAVKDAALIAAAQRVEHYEISGYGTAKAFAKALGHQEAMRLLLLTETEESNTDRKLTQLAETSINTKALHG